MISLEARQVSKLYHKDSAAEVRALVNVSLTIEPGSFTLLTGPSGSGKSTLLALLGALDRATSGQVFFNGKDLGRCSGFELARVRRCVGFVFQSFSLIPGLTVWENISYPLIPRGMSRAERFQRAQSLLERLNLLARQYAQSNELSGGEQQRVAIARALGGEPEVVLADEPTSNLDPESSAAVLAAFKAVHAEGKTVILASHDPQWASVRTHVYELDKGTLKKR